MKLFGIPLLSASKGQSGPVTVVAQNNGPDLDDLDFFGSTWKPTLKQDPMTAVVFDKTPTFFLPLQTSTLKTGKELFDEQISHLGSALLVDDYDANVTIDTCQLTSRSRFKFPQGALLSGSYVMHVVANSIGHVEWKYDDCDIYFKTKEDAKQFVTDNAMHGIHITDSPVCAYGYHEGMKFNLIYGVEYTSIANLIGRFDIRACSMAIDPNTMELHVVRGAVEDATRKQLVFNSVPRGCSMRRYAKYITKGFHADSHQNLFFVELLKTEIYKPELELLTKEY